MDMNPYFNMKDLRNYGGLKNLALDNRILQADDFFDNLPVHLQSLKFVLYVADILLKPIQNFEKICLKSFTIKFIKDPEVKSLIKDPMEVYDIRISMLSQFACFIEFKKLAELKFELNGESMFLDTEIYEIK
ncbi:putative LRR containing protein [Trachipleistophora hominis]|uniref:Putative LRR containing protein n=1 Tax=Trachipleistophora hominis TaxID=72359 RepID=L7JTI3_TRAHO|nr:putative LRR containing protein [Trachipleistophora hominis]